MNEWMSEYSNWQTEWMTSYDFDKQGMILFLWK